MAGEEAAVLSALCHNTSHLLCYIGVKNIFQLFSPDIADCVTVVEVSHMGTEDDIAREFQKNILIV